MSAMGFAAVTEDGIPRRFVGMHRPPWEQYQSGGGFIHCTCGMILQTYGATRDHWQMGHFDRALYETPQTTRPSDEVGGS